VLVDGVRMDEIIEGTVGTLHILAREAQSRSSIRAMKCMPLLVQVRLLQPYHTCSLLIRNISVTVLFSSSVVLNGNAVFDQCGNLPGKPGKVREFHVGYGNVRKLRKVQEIVICL